MKRCPSCNRNYTDDTLRFCLDDGTPLVVLEEPSTAPTVIMPVEPPATVALEPGRFTIDQPQATQASATWAPAAPPKPQRQVWPWVLGGIALLVVLGLGLAGVLLALVSISSSENSSDRSTPVASPTVAQEPTPRPALAKVEITSVHMARDSGSGEPGDEVDSFSPSDRTVFCVVELNEAQAGSTVKFIWTAVDAGELKDHVLKELEYTTKADEKKVHAHLTLQQDWPAGAWKVDVYLNGQFARSIAYAVE
jgi:hypothetical protein